MNLLHVLQHPHNIDRSFCSRERWWWNREESRRVFVFNHSRWSQRRRERKSHKYINTKMSARSESAAPPRAGAPPFLVRRTFALDFSAFSLPSKLCRSTCFLKPNRIKNAKARRLVLTKKDRFVWPDEFICYEFLRIRDLDAVKCNTLMFSQNVGNTENADQTENLKLIKESKECV